MEITANNLLDQVSQVILAKLQKQDLDPDLLTNFFAPYIDRFKKKNQKVDSTAEKTSYTTSTPPSNKPSLVEQIKQAYKELLKDQSYVNESKKFKEKTEIDSLATETNNKQKENLTERLIEKFKETTVKTKDSAPAQKANFKEGRKTLIEEKPKPQEVILAGFTERGSRSLKEKFGGIFKNFFDKLKGVFDNLQSPKGGLGLIGGALALLLGGLAALVTGLMTDGPFKGLLKILSQVGLQGGIKLLEMAAKTFMTGLKAVINAPIDLLKTAAKSIGKLFGKDVYRMLLAPLRGLSKILSNSVDDILRGITSSVGSLFTGLGNILKNSILNIGKQIMTLLPKSLGGGLASTILKPLSGLGSLFGSMFKGLATKIAPLLKPIPLIGFAISLGFAYTRFKKGDVVGGTIDILSGIASFIPGVGTAVSLGLGVLNAILDFKGGGASQKASEKKSGILVDWLKGLGTLVLKGLKSLPIIGPAIKAVEEFSAGNYLKGIKQLAYIATPLEFIGALLGDKEASGITKTGASVVRGIGSILGTLVKWMGTALYRGLKSLPIIGPAIKAVEEFSAGNFLKGIKQLAYIATPLEFIGALLGDTEASGITKVGASVVRGIGSILKSLGAWVAETIWKTISNLPIIGPALRGAKELFSGNFGEAFKQFLYINPAFEFLGVLLGDTNIGGITGATAGAVKGIGSMLKNLGIWVHEQIIKLPVVGPLIKMISNFTNGEWKEGLKNLGRAVGLGGLISFFESKPETTNENTDGGIKNPFTALREALLAKARKWWKSAWSWVRWLARRVLPTSVIEALDQEANEKIETEFSVDKGEQGRSALGQAFDRLKEAFKGALSNVSKTISNVANSVKDGAKNIALTGINAAKSLSNSLKETKDKVFSKVSGFFKSMTNNVTSGIKKYWDNLSWDPKTWIGMSSGTPKPPIQKAENKPLDPREARDKENLQKQLDAASTKEEKEEILQRWENNKQTLVKANEEALEKYRAKKENETSSPSKIITNNNNILTSANIKENKSLNEPANQEATKNEIPSINLNSDLNNNTLKLIATNTDNTNTNIKTLSETLLRLVVVLDKKLSSGNTGSTIVNMQGDSKQIPSASQVANTNYNTIGNIRQQFRQMQFT